MKTQIFFGIILIVTSINLGATNTDALIHPVIVNAPAGYKYKSVLSGDTLYNNQTKDEEQLSLESFSSELSFQNGTGIRIVQSSQHDKNSSAEHRLLSLRANFIPNFAVAYNSREDKIPKWLQKDYQATENFITTRMNRTGKPGPSFRVFEYIGPRNEVTLGGNGSSENMYLIIVRSGKTIRMKR